MSKESTEQKIVHEQIQSDIKYIKDTLVKIDDKFAYQNSKVARAEAGIIEVGYSMQDLKKALEADAYRIKLLEEKNQKEVEEEINLLRKRDVAFRERLMWGVLTTILFILGFLGIINVDFIKTII